MVTKPVYKRPIGRIVLTALFLLVCGMGHAQIALSACFSDNMVLQQQTKVNIWGTESPGKSLSIVTSWNTATYKTTADADGNWSAKISTPVYGGPYTITFNDGQVVTLKTCY